jgi:hypothetical protein
MILAGVCQYLLNYDGLYMIVQLNGRCQEACITILVNARSMYYKNPYGRTLRQILRRAGGLQPEGRHGQSVE